MTSSFTNPTSASPTVGPLGDATIIGEARGANNSCTTVARHPNGDITLINQVGGRLLIPAGEVMATAALMLRRDVEKEADG